MKRSNYLTLYQTIMQFYGFVKRTLEIIVRKGEIALAPYNSRIVW